MSDYMTGQQIISVVEHLSKYGEVRLEYFDTGIVLFHVLGIEEYSAEDIRLMEALDLKFQDTTWDGEPGAFFTKTLWY